METHTVMNVDKAVAHCIVTMTIMQIIFVPSTHQANRAFEK